MTEEKSPLEIIRQAYEPIVKSRYPAEVSRWPILTGCDIKTGGYKGWLAIFLKHTSNPTMVSTSGLGELSRELLGFDEINDGNLESVRRRLLHHFRATLDDALILVPPSGALEVTELEKMLARHEAALGLSKMKIFLSHKSPDKALVRDFKSALEVLGLDPWLDEDSMAAGAQLNRSILQGMQESCAAVFFLTPNFADEAFLASEINYAIDEHHNRPNQFSIITLVFEDGGRRPTIPALLKPFVWKEPATPLQGFKEIIRALPIMVGPPQWR